MNYVFDQDVKLTNQLYEERRRELAQSYAGGRSDTAQARKMVAGASTFLGSLLIRAGHALTPSSNRRQGQQLQPLRVRSEGNN